MNKTINKAQERKLALAMRNLEAKPKVATLLGGHRDGMLIDDLTEDIAKTLYAVRRSGKKGEITIKLTFTPAKGDSGQVILSDAITTKIPKPDVKVSTMFIGGDNLPVFDDPAQMEITDIEADEHGEIKVID